MLTLVLGHSILEESKAAVLYTDAIRLQLAFLLLSSAVTLHWVPGIFLGF